MLSTDLPDGSWQRQVFDATRSQIVATDPKLGAWVDMIAPTPEQVAYLEALSGKYLDAVQGSDGNASPFERQAAVRGALSDVYDSTGGEALVRQHHPELFTEPVKRGPGRPRLDGTAPGTPRAHELPPVLTGDLATDAYTMLNDHDEALQIAIDRQHVADELWQEMRRFAERIAETDHMLGSVQFGDTYVRTFAPSELATLLGVTTQTLTNWRAGGWGPKSVKTGVRSDAVRYPVFRVVEWLLSTGERDES